MNQCLATTEQFWQARIYQNVQSIALITAFGFPVLEKPHMIPMCMYVVVLSILVYGMFDTCVLIIRI